jgi:hypothetical protein
MAEVFRFRSVLRRWYFNVKRQVTNMLLDTYQADERFWITTFFGATGEGLQAFRGDFVITPGELNVAAGKRNPPEVLLRQAVMLAGADSLKLIAGNLARVDALPELIAGFGPDMGPDSVVALFIDNLGADAVVEQDGRRYVLIQHGEGIVWNELMELFYVEKSDLKGQSAEDKVATVHQAGQGYEPKAPVQTLDEVIAAKTDVVREAWGAV